MAIERYSPFDFIRNRYNSIEPTELEKESFDLYMTNMVLSMSNDACVPNVLNITNSIKFTKLTKRQQCMAFTSLNKKYLSGKWCLPKKESKEASKEYISKVMLVLECSESDAKSMIQSGHLSAADIEACYVTIYDEQKKSKKKQNDKSTNKSSDANFLC